MLVLLYKMVRDIAVRFVCGDFDELLSGISGGYLCIDCDCIYKHVVEEERKRQIDKIYTYKCSGGVLGGILYLVVMKVLLWHGGVELASYKGAGNFTLKMIVENFPNSFMKCYQFYYDFFANQFMYVRTSITKMVLVAFFVCLLINILYGFIRIFTESKIRALLFGISILLIPAAGNASLLLAVGNTPTLLMSMGMIYTVVLFTVLIPKERTIGFLSKRVCAGILALIVWVSVITVGNDQLALMEGKTATISLTQNIVSELGERGYMDYEHPIALVGRPANNDTFAWNPAYSTSNDYAKFGAWSTDAGNNRRSWLGVLNEYCGVGLSFCGEETYNEIKVKEEVSAMPEFPAEGSIIEVDGVVVVKVSDVY